MFYPNTFQTGKVLDRGETETSITLPYLNASVAHGYSKSGIELRGYCGYSGWDIAGFGLAMSKALIKSQYLNTSGTADAEFLLSLGNDYAGMRFTGTYAIGCNPVDWFCIYVPLKIGYLYYDWNGEKGKGFSFIPGFGISLRLPQNVFFRGGINIVVPHEFDQNLTQVGYIGLNISQIR